MHCPSFVYILSITLLFSVVYATEEKITTNVFTLTVDNFDDLTSKGKWLIEFYAPWCGHCKKLAPIYDLASLRLLDSKNELNLAKVDCTSETSICSKYEIHGYPTLKYFRSGINTPYEGGRTLESILEFARKATREPIQHISENTLPAFQAANRVSFLLVGGSELASEVFTDVAKRLQESVSFAQGPASLKSKFGRKDEGFIVILNDDDPQVYDGPFKADDISKWVLKNRFPLFIELGASNYQAIVENGKRTVIAVVDPADPLSTPYLDTFRAVAKKYKNQFNFGYINGKEHSQFVSHHGAGTYPNFFVIDGDGSFSDSLSITGAHTEETIGQYLQDLLAGKVEVKGAGGFDRVVRFVQTNAVYFAAGLAVVIALIMLCCIVGSDDKPLQKVD